MVVFFYEGSPNLDTSHHSTSDTDKHSVKRLFYLYFLPSFFFYDLGI